MIERPRATPLRSRAAAWCWALSALACSDSAPSTPGDRLTTIASADDLCGGTDRTCCSAPRQPCEPGLRCDEASGLCRDDVGSSVLCRRDADCPADRQCCLAGAYGTCGALDAASACAQPDLAVLASGRGVTLSENAFDGVTRSDGGCLRPRGMRRRLRAAVAIANLGDTDFILGWRDSVLVDGVSASDEFLRYRLIDASGETVAESHAQLPCNEDDDPSQTFSCAFGGLTPGELVPTPGRECEALDVTELPPGSYRLRVELAFAWPDADPSNGWTEMPVELPSFESLAACPAVPNPLQGLDVYRECGWSQARLPGDGTCNPGDVAWLDCQGCTATPLLRVCTGDAICSAGAAISNTLGFFEPGTTDGGPCASLQVICPWTGRYNVMIASEDPTPSGPPCTLVSATEF